MTKEFMRPRRAPCTFRAFRVGFIDWWAERLHPDASRRAQPAPAARRVVRVVMLGLLVLAAPVVAALFAPLAAGTMSAVGTQAVARTSEAAAVVVGLACVVGLPVWAGWRTLRFCGQMCERGQDILEGRRPRVRFL